MKALIGVDPHKASVAVAVVDEGTGELLECATFPHNRTGLRALERWAKRFGKRRWAVENAGGLGRHLAQRLAAAGESVVDVPSPSFRHGCGCSLPVTLARAMSWTQSGHRVGCLA
jgi:transposase